MGVIRGQHLRLHVILDGNVAIITSGSELETKFRYTFIQRETAVDVCKGYFLIGKNVRAVRCYNNVFTGVKALARRLLSSSAG